MSIPEEIPYEFDSIEIEFSSSPSKEKIKEIAQYLETALNGKWHIEQVFDDHNIFIFETDNRDVSSELVFDTVALLIQGDDIAYASPNFQYGEIDPAWEFNEFRVQASMPPKETIGTEDFEWHLSQVLAKEAWALKTQEGGDTRGSGVIIGHIDTGYTEHYEYVGNANIDVENGYNFFEKTPSAIEPLRTIQYGHGTATGSILVSQEGPSSTNPSLSYVSGISPKSTLIPIRVDKNVWFLNPRKDIKGIMYALQKDCHVISMSRSGLGRRSFQVAVEKAQKQGVIIVAASGNCIPSCKVFSPANYPSVVCAGGTTISKKPWHKSSRGSEVDICAPAHLVWRARTRKIDNDYSYDVQQSSGTSYAAPIVAGAAALWIAYHGGHTTLAQKLGGADKIPLAFRMLLEGPGASKPDGKWDTQEHGSGILNTVGLLSAPLPKVTSEEVEKYAKDSINIQNVHTKNILENVNPALDSKSKRLIDEEIDFLLMTKREIGELHDQYIRNEISLDMFTTQFDQSKANQSSSQKLRNIFSR